METPQLRSQLGTAADRDRMAGLMLALEEAYLARQQVANHAAISKAKGGA